jgi:hypothetical protein
MALQQAVEVPPPFQSVDDVVTGLDALERRLHGAGDLRGLFATTYRATTHTIREWIVRGVFLDNDKMACHVVVFANAYRSALADCAAGDPASAATAWRQSFDACNDDGGTPFQCLALGINAHMNFDLPYAVINAGLDVDCSHCYHDYVRINDALRLNVPLVRKRILAAYRRDFSLREQWFGCLIDARVAHSLEHGRRHAWALARLLARAETAAARAEVDRMIDDRSTSLGEKILGHRKAPASSVAALCQMQPATRAAFGGTAPAAADVRRALSSDASRSAARRDYAASGS